MKGQGPNADHTRHISLSLCNPIPYGRGSQDLAIQVKAETGSTDSIQSLKEDIDVMMEVWKTETYPDAWRYMLECAESVVDPGFLMNPWGRARIFPKTDDRENVAKMGREAQNFPAVQDGEVKQGELREFSCLTTIH